MSYDLCKLEEYIENENVDAINYLMQLHDLTIKDGKIIANIKEQASEKVTFWNQRQQARKILLNSL